jgi:DNA-binding MarR family transcriptional regulator
LPTTKKNPANELADLTFKLLVNLQEKEARIAEKHDLAPAEFRCLRNFVFQPAYSNKDISRAMHLSPSRLTRIVDALSEKGYVVRKINKADRRNMAITLTSKGQTITKKLDKTFVDANAELLKSFGKSQQKDVITSMERLLEAVENWINKG